MYDWGIVFVVWLIGYGFGYNGGYKIAERRFRDYLRDKYNDTFPMV